jgi:hypothetical protein
VTNQVNAAINQTLKTQPAGSKLYNLASQYRHWINQASNETERLETINEAYRTFIRNGIIKA